MAASDPDPKAKSNQSPADQVNSGSGKRSEVDAPSSSTSAEPSATDLSDTGEVTVHSHHISKLLDEVLETPDEESPTRKYRHPMVMDLVLTLGLLMVVGGFTTGLFKMYLTHSAEQSITQHNYRAAIAILKGAPLSNFFVMPGSDPAELLNQALYLDAIDRMEVHHDVNGALQDLQQILPGSNYFPLAQEIISENFTPSSTTLEGGASVSERAVVVPVKKPLLPETPAEGSP